ncbi:DUF2795 domain-containing protein [Streptomyces sp. NPDC007157]|uniref:DUF2795 domain-containing protein n=1 Tax=Streptomyces sp. NPDC007157 TaxID=3154681 RepID=UPI00340A231B
MQRGSDRLSVHRDEEMKHELRDLLRSGHPTRTEEWNDPEPPAEDDPEVYRAPMLPWTSDRPSLATVRLELARSLTRQHDFPAQPSELVRVLRRGHASDALVHRVSRLPRSTRYRNLLALAEAVTGEE